MLLTPAISPGIVKFLKDVVAGTTGERGWMVQLCACLAGACRKHCRRLQYVFLINNVLVPLGALLPALSVLGCCLFALLPCTVVVWQHSSLTPLCSEPMLTLEWMYH